MYCPRCGASNPEDATYCKNCGNPLQPGNASPQPPPPAPYYGSLRPSPKNPVVAAILNLFFGVGYLYLGYRRVTGVPTGVFVVITFIAYIIFGLFAFGIITLIIAIVLAIDGYQKGDGQRGFIPAEF
jgi:zinc-ribbon domain